jgi:hypothetical protein
MVNVEQEFSAAEITLSMYGPVFELMDVLTDYAGSGGALDISGLVGDRGFAAGIDMGGPLALGWVGKGGGFGVFNRTRGDAVVTGNRVRPVLSEEVILMGGYSWRLVDANHHALSLGFVAKAFFRGVVNMEASIFDASEIISTPFNKPFSTHLGLGADLGLLYSFKDFSAALVGYDPFSPVILTKYRKMGDFGKEADTVTSFARVKPRLDLGLAYRIRWPFLERFVSRFVIMADYRDFLDLAELVPRNPILNVGLGLELTLLEILSLRAGINDALPSLGLGLDLHFMKLDCAIRGKELGLDPGVNPVYAIDIGLLFRY